MKYLITIGTLTIALGFSVLCNVGYLKQLDALRAEQDRLIKYILPDKDTVNLVLPRSASPRYMEPCKHLNMKGSWEELQERGAIEECTRILDERWGTE